MPRGDRGPNHGYSQNKSTTYRSWLMMKNRCLNPRATDYGYYGGRGITVCKRWHRFLNFLEDMGEKPTILHTIGRKSSKRGYTPANCRWETRKEQSQSRAYCKLNAAKVRIARKMYKAGTTRKALAALFGVGKTTIAYAVTRKTWK